jgi:hypothetical protein
MIFLSCGLEYYMDFENTCSAWGAKLLWKTKILSIEHAFDRSAPDVGPRKQFTDPDLENLRQIEHLDVEDAANPRFDLGHGCSGHSPAAMLQLGRKFGLRPTMPIPQLTYLRSYDIAVPHRVLRAEDPSRQELASAHLFSDRHPQSSVEVKHL